MKKSRLLILSLIAFAASKGQQQPPVTPTPPCVIPFFMSNGGGGPQAPVPLLGFDNRQSGCTNWDITYSSSGYSAITLTVESAPTSNNVAPGTAGTWVTFAGTVVTGINPNTSITQAETTLTGYFPWIRVRLTASTTGSVGNIVGVLIGTVPINAGGGVNPSAGGCVGTIATPCVVVGPTASGAPPTTSPVLISGQTGSGAGPGNIETLHVDTVGDAIVVGPAVAGAALSGAPVNIGTSDGVNVIQSFICTKTAYVSLAASGNAQVIALSAATNIRICHIHLSTATVMTEIDITTGTGANCVTGNAVIDSYMNITAIAIDFQPTAALQGGASNALCINPSGAGALKGVIQYAQF
jgi:hypothetical protein